MQRRLFALGHTCESCAVNPALQELFSFLLESAHEELAQLKQRMAYAGRPAAQETGPQARHIAARLFFGHLLCMDV